MKELKFRSWLRVFNGIKNSLEVEPNWQYLTQEHAKYIYYKREMKRWRSNVKHVDFLKKEYGGVTN